MFSPKFTLGCIGLQAVFYGGAVTLVGLCIGWGCRLGSKIPPSLSTLHSPPLPPSGMPKLLSGLLLLLAGPWVQAGLQAGPHGQAGTHAAPAVKWNCWLYSKVEEGCRLSSAIRQATGCALLLGKFTVCVPCSVRTIAGAGSCVP